MSVYIAAENFYGQTNIQSNGGNNKDNAFKLNSHSALFCVCDENSGALAAHNSIKRY